MAVGAGLKPPLDDLGLLAPGAGALEPPIRSVLFGRARFEQHGRSLARTHEVVSVPASRRGFFPRLNDNIRVLRRSCALLERQAREGQFLGPAANWLLDNAALLGEQSTAIREGLPRSFFRLLPRLRDQPLAGLPRVYGVAWAWVSHTDSGFDVELLEAYLQAYCEERELSLAELWALPTTLRVVLVENLRRLAERAAAQQAAREAAHHWFDQSDAERHTGALDVLDATTRQRGVSEAFLLILEQRHAELAAEPSHALLAWLQPRLADTVGTLTRQQTEATEDQQSVRNAITTLRQLDRVDWRKLFAGISTAMQVLQRAPVHAAEREDTQDATLHAVERLSRAARRPEPEVAQAILALTQTAATPDDPAAAPAHWWRGAGEPQLRRALNLPRRWLPRAGTAQFRRGATVGYLAGVTALTAGGIVWLLQHHADPAAPTWLLAMAALLLLGPASEAVVAVVNRLISESAAPTRLPRLAFAAGIPAQHRVLVVMPCMLGNAAAVDLLAAQLEQHFLANREPQAQFALLSDWADASAASMPGDAALLAAATGAVETLNRRHPADVGAPLRFLLLHRQRQWSASERSFIGWERKRGKLEQLIRLLAEPAHRPFIDLGALSAPAAGSRYIVTLDSDTDMPPGRLRDLVGVAAHPLNLPRVDAAHSRVVAGYGILQPRVVTPLPAPGAVTPYHQLFSGQCGIDPYSAASSEIYQDVFGEGTFTGKGLLHVHALHQVLVDKLPEGQVLSHDLLEGAIARCAGVSDVTVVEDAPVHADVAASRLHRWTRGDWQLLPFLAGPALPWISRWKMLDNLRRSLVVPASLLLLVLVLASGVLSPAWALAAVAAAFGAGPLLGAIAGLAPSRDDIGLRRFYLLAGADLLRALLLPLWHVAQLLQLGLLYADAIGRALHRQFVSRRHLLQWTTAAAAQAAARSDLRGLWAAHRAVPISAAVLLFALACAALLGAPVAWPFAAALLLLWAASPVWTWWASRPRPDRSEGLSAPARHYLQGVARDTWRYYERHVTAADNSLPPDNVQQVPHVLVAHRTSPTNIGMVLLASACARQLGFIGDVDLADRLTATLATLDKLPRHRGHFYNWYDTQSLAVLPPAYVSTVDSGNCSGHMLAAAAACEAAALDGRHEATLQAALQQAQRRLQELQPAFAGKPALHTLAALAAGQWQWPATASETRALQARVRSARAELDALAAPLPARGSDEETAVWLFNDLVATLQSALADRLTPRAQVVQRLQALAVRLRQMALEPDYAMLYDRERRLLSIGYRADTGQRDDSHYDLLASEARLTSLLAIAKGDVPVQHWAALGRPFFAEGTEVGLKSWSGSMFEYLMPTLVLTEPVGSVLHQMARSAVAEQQREARKRGTPWGISESAIAGQDHTLAYQYGPQGVPRLALRRTPPDERVVAPYATALALMVAPASAVANLQALQAIGARGTMGFIEALDYSPQRQTSGGPFVAVHTFMAHHQAMSLVACTHVLADGAARRWTAADPCLRAVTALLHERAPREVPLLRDPPPPPAPRRTRVAHVVFDTEPLADALPATQLLTNGRHAVVLRSHGGGYSQWDGLHLTRWRDDLLRDTCGSFFYVQRAGSTARHSITAHPAADPAARYTCRMQTDRVVFDATWPDLQARCTVWVSPEDDCELRQLELTNTGSEPLALTLSAASEVTLAPPRADEAHPGFSNLFVQARWDADENALYLRRQPRLPTEDAVQAVHFLALADGPVGAVGVCTDRARWLGRYGSAQAPLGDGGASTVSPAVAPRSDGTADGAVRGTMMDTGVDPVAVIGVQLRLAPGATRKLTFGTAAARDGDLLGALVDKYRQASHVARASSMSHTMAGIRLRELQFDADAWTALLHVNTLLTALVTREAPAGPRGHGSASTSAAAPRCDRRLLWRHGISGDRPLVLVAISGEEGLGLVQTLKRALRMWAAAGIGVDLVVVNSEPASYLTPVQNQLQQLKDRLQAQQDEHAPADRRAALHLLREADIGADERHTFHTLARLRLQADARPLAQQLERLVDDHRRDGLARTVMPSRLVAPLRPPPVRQPPAPVQPPAGRFVDGRGNFVFDVSPAQHPSRPWINVLANPQFGALVSEVAGGCTWAGNSRMHQVTGWSNDALSDPAGEWLLLHDVDNGRVWPLGRRLEDGAAREVTHGQGFTRMRQAVAGIDVTLTWCVDAEAAVKQLQVALRCDGPRPRRLRLVAMVEWMLGSARQERLSLATRVDRVVVGPEGAGLPEPATALALQATQMDHLGGFGDATAFLGWRLGQPGDAAGLDSVQLAVDDWTCDRREFFDTAGRMVLPARLGRQSGAGLDACAALACTLAASGRTAHVTLLLGHAATPHAASALFADTWRADPAQRLTAQRAVWPALAGAVQVQTPDARFDALVNHWLPYQTVACRLWARAAFYQAGGAYGFRDQLQDAMSMVGRAPQLLAQQIRANAARQFPEGDVQHWWHAPGGAGVRTHFSDDLLWLPLAVALYVARTGDARLLDEDVPFLAGASVPEGAEDIYETPAVSEQRASIYEHAARAIDRSLRTGAHGLPLFGTGDWNDGMNRVGHEGRGESVWLAWFLCQVVDDFLPLAAGRGDAGRVADWRTARSGWAAALDAAGWDGAWYRRGYFDDGTPLGTAGNAECRIDLIAQAWAVLSGAGDPARARQAMASARSLLVDPAAQLVKLLDPPLQHAAPSAGYIQAYPPGVRENGGQYNHGAVWALMALARLGDNAGVWGAFTALSPAHRWLDPERGAAYGIEPYVMAGDIYTQPPWVGRGGWSWYTGAAGWLMRAGVESICGVVLARGTVTVAPCLPPHWPQATVVLAHGGHQHRFIVCADETLARAACQREPAARRAAVGQAVDLALLDGASVHVVAAATRAVPPAAPTAAVLRAGDGAVDLL